MLFSPNSRPANETVFRNGRQLHGCAAVLLVLSAIFTLGAQQQTGTGSATPKPEEMITLSGRAVNAQSGEPLSKVELRLFSGRSNAFQGTSVFTARSTADGAFTIRSVPPGDYLLNVTRRAFASQSAEVRGLPGSRVQGRNWMVSLRAGQQFAGIEIRMPPAAVVTGQVFDEEGEPMAGVTIEAEQYRYIRGTKILSASGRATTDDRGIYRIFDLSPGRYFVKAQGRSLRARFGAAMRGGMFGGGPGAGPGGFGGPGGPGGGAAMMAALQESAAYPETYYPSARSAAQAIPLQLAPGAEMGGIDFTLAPSPTFSIAGTVSGGAQGDGSSILVTARPAGLPGFGGDAAGMTPANPQTGEFVIQNLPPGSYELIARSNNRRRGGGPASGAIGVTTVELGSASVDGITIPVFEEVTINGRVVLPEGAATDQLARMAIIPERRLVPVRASTRVDAAGAFSLSISPAEAPRFTISNIPEGLYLKRLSLGSVDLLASSPAAGVAVSGELRVELASDGASLSGFVRDSRDAGIAGARVTILPARDLSSATSPAREAWRKTVTTGDDGNFQISDIAPGRYRLYAFESLDADPSFDLDFLSNFGQRWKELELKAKETATVEPTLIPSADTAMFLGEVQ